MVWEERFVLDVWRLALLMLVIGMMIGFAITEMF